MLSEQNPSIVPPPSRHHWHANVGASRTLYARVSASAVTPLVSDALVQAPRPPPAQAESPRGELHDKAIDRINCFGRGGLRPQHGNRTCRRNRHFPQLQYPLLHRRSEEHTSEL